LFQFLKLQTNASTHPRRVHPRKKLKTPMAVVFQCFLFDAMIVGKKYSNKPNINNKTNKTFIFSIKFNYL